MTLEVVYGEPRHRAIALRLSEFLKSTVPEGTVYLGYPVLATAEDRVYVDALLVAQQVGLVAFQVAEGVPATPSDWESIIDDQDRLFRVLESHLGRHEGLRQGRKLAVAVETVTVFPTSVKPPRGSEGHYCSLDEVGEVMAHFAPLDDALIRSLEAALQRVTTIKPAKRRRGVVQSHSRGAVLKEIEKGIANLDQWQKQAAIETPEGPQRIRGLAGSGKTIVLALKAAYLHAQHPDWRIAICFQSRSLYQQLEDLVTRFTFEHSNDKPDFEKLQLLHAWGASNREGAYKTIARSMGATFRDWNYALSTFGRSAAFAGACQELLDIARSSNDQPIFDAVLVDEAQDLPPSFFQLLYRFTHEPKRIVWAFDEMQNLSEAVMPTTLELFGTRDDGEPLVSLADSPGEARRDIVLPVCYRNSPWALATAHALGFGLYRPAGIVQHFDDLELWTQIGYSVTKGSLQHGRKVVLERSKNSYPEYFPELLTPTDAVLLRRFKSEAEQDAWVAEAISKNLREEELEIDDILVVLPDAVTSKRRAARFAQALSRRAIDSHLAGVSSSVDQLFVTESIAMAHIYRAKGNEAPMVYVLDAHYASGTFNAVSRRNTLFTAITRSRAWVRICGWGDQMNEIADEVQRVADEDYKLAFKIPTAAQLDKLRRIHRERSSAEVASIERATRSFTEALETFQRDDVGLEHLPPKERALLRARLRELLAAEDAVDEPDE